MMHLITQAEYARRRKVSREAVRKAIESKRITGIPHQGRVMLDPDVADIQWARNTNVDQQQRGAPGQFETTQQRAQEALQGALEMRPVRKARCWSRRRPTPRRSAGN